MSHHTNNNILDNIKKITSKHHHLSSVVHDLNSQLPVDKKTCERLITQLMANCDDIKLNAFRPNTIDVALNWEHICKCIKHEMYPMLSSAVESIISNTKEVIVNVDDISTNAVNKLIERLQKKRKLGNEEVHYLRKLVKRARNYNNKQKRSVDIIREDTTDFGKNYNGLNMPLLKDIFDVHRLFVFGNLHFEDYTIEQFKTDFQKADIKISKKAMYEKIVANKNF
eukprot:180356_1